MDFPTVYLLICCVLLALSVAAMVWIAVDQSKELKEARRVMMSAAALLSERRNQMAYAQLFYYLHPPKPEYAPPEPANGGMSQCDS